MSGKATYLATIHFEAEVIHWRGPSPYFFVVLPHDCAMTVRETARAVSYGWGMIPVEARIEQVDFKTALFPKDDSYFLPLKDAVRKRVEVTVGDLIAIDLKVPPVRR